MDDQWKQQKIENIAMLLQGAIQANSKVGLKFNLLEKLLEDVQKILPAMKRPTISPLAGEEWIALEIIVEEEVVRTLIPELKKAGAEDIIEYPLNKVIH